MNTSSYSFLPPPYSWLSPLFPKSSIATQISGTNTHSGYTKKNKHTGSRYAGSLLFQPDWHGNGILIARVAHFVPEFRLVYALSTLTASLWIFHHNFPQRPENFRKTVTLSLNTLVYFYLLFRARSGAA